MNSNESVSIPLRFKPSLGDESKSKIPPNPRLPPYFRSKFWTDFGIYRSLPHAQIVKNPKWTKIGFWVTSTICAYQIQVEKFTKFFFWNIGQGNSSFLNHHTCRQNITKRKKLQKKPPCSDKKDLILDYIGGLHRKTTLSSENGCSINETAFLLQLEIVVKILRCFKKLPRTNSYCIFS